MCFHWPAHMAVWEAELDAARREEQHRLAIQQARADHRLAQQVGAGALAICATALATLVDAEGHLVRPVPAREIGWLATAAVATLSWAHGEVAPEGSGEKQTVDPAEGLRQVLDTAPEDVKMNVLRGMQGQLGIELGERL